MEHVLEPVVHTINTDFGPLPTIGSAIVLLTVAVAALIVFSEHLVWTNPLMVALGVAAIVAAGFIYFGIDAAKSDCRDLFKRSGSVAFNERGCHYIVTCQRSMTGDVFCY